MGSAGSDMAQGQPVRSTTGDNDDLHSWDHKITAVKHPEINKNLNCTEYGQFIGHSAQIDLT